MSYSSAARYIPEAKRLAVSQVARSSSGFMGVYKRMKSASEMKKKIVRRGHDLTWGRKREAFIARHMAQYRKNPTYRRWLALVMWAYKPPGKVPK